MIPLAAIDLMVLAVPYLIWPYLGGVGTTVFYCLQGLQVVYVGGRARSLSWRWIPFSWVAYFLGSQQVVCGALFPPKGGHLCDDGTGFPLILFTAFVVAACAAYYARRHRA